MNIVGKYKVKKLGLFDIESGWKMVSVDELMGMEETEEVIQAKEMSETTMVVSEDGTISIRIVPSPETIAEAKVEGEEIPLNEDGTVSLQDFEWKEENGELFYNTGDECEIDGEAVDPWIKIEFDEDGLLVLTMMAFEKI